MTASVLVTGKLLPETMKALEKWQVETIIGEELTEENLIKKAA
ncbi:glyoxylate reductase, partial [Listeria seeligeri FSL N1-067]